MGAWWTKADAGAERLAAVTDPAIDALAPSARAALAEIWQRRGGLELRVGSAFATIAVELFEHGADPPVLELVTRAARDEIRHAEYSVDVAARYRGDAARWPRPAPTPIPDLAPAGPKLRATLHVLAMCCINETIACACLQAALGQVESPLVKAAQQLILADEIDHARAGWAHLASRWVDAEMKAELSTWLVRLFSAKLRELVEDEAPLPGEQFPEQGMLSREVTTRVVRGTLDSVIFPGLARAGLDVSDVTAWARGAFGGA